MGMLERMISNAIKRETGFNPRRLIRRMGGGNLLMAGGAAIAGGLLAQQMQKSAGSVVGAAPPSGGGTSLPPTSNAAEVPVPPQTREIPSPPLPPLPPVPTASSPTAPPAAEPAPEGELELPAALRFAITRTMIAAALADGQLDAAEKDLIDEQLGAGEFDAEQTSQLRKDLVVPPGVRELAKGLPTGEEPELLLQFAVLSARAHGDVSDRERTWLQGFAGALGLPNSAVAEAERELFDGGGS